MIELYLYSTQYNNALPESGGIYDQNAVVMEALSVVRGEMHKVERWREHESKIKHEQETATKRKNRPASTRS